MPKKVPIFDQHLFLAIRKNSTCTTIAFYGIFGKPLNVSQLVLIAQQDLLSDFQSVVEKVANFR